MRVIRGKAASIVLAAVGLFWLVPTVGLLATSVRPVATYGQSGW